MIPLKDQVREFVKFDEKVLALEIERLCTVLGKDKPISAESMYYIISKINKYQHARLAPLLELLPDVVEALEFYAQGAGLEIVDEGRNCMVRMVAYENDLRENSEMHLDEPVGAWAKRTLAKIKEAVGGK